MYTHIYVKHFSFSLVTWQRALSLTFHNNSLVVHFFSLVWQCKILYFCALLYFRNHSKYRFKNIYKHARNKKNMKRKEKKSTNFYYIDFELFFPGPLHKAWFCNCAFELWLDMHSNHMSWLLLFQVHICTDIRYYIFRIKSHVNLTIELFNKRIISSAIL